MRTLRKLDIETMSKELQVLKNPEKFLGGGPTYWGQGSLDCVLQTVAYLSGTPLQEVHDWYANYINTQELGGDCPVTSDASAGMGCSANEAMAIYSNFMGGSCCNYNTSNFDSGTNWNDYNLSGAMAGFNFSGSDHMVAITGFTSGNDGSGGIFTYWDEQNQCSGTFSADDLEDLFLDDPD